MHNAQKNPAYSVLKYFIEQKNFCECELELATSLLLIPSTTVTDL